ncbi:MAG TPA: TonB-dependent receptor [Vicinamibacterales bacterium]|jgi:hypothetical protein
MKNRFYRRRIAAAVPLILFCLLALAVPAVAQLQLATIQGTVTDQTGGVLPGVTVTATNTGTRVARSTVTNERGVYRLPSIEPGVYDVTVELQGFGKLSRPKVDIEVGATLGLNFTLQPGAIAETITVTGEAPMVQTEIASVSAVVERKQLEALPLVGRNVMALAALQPGINGIPGSTDFLSAEQGLGITASGQRGSGNNAMVDGMSINGTPWGGTVLVVPNAEAVQEFQVISNNQSAEYGRNSGAAVSIVTRGGTNRFSGSLFEFHRDQSLRARGMFETKKPDFKRNDFGGSFGGPVKRDRTFFFGSFEGVREVSGSGSLVTVETEAFVNYVTSTRPNSIAAKLLSTYRPPSYPTTGLTDLGSPAKGANVYSKTLDGIPDVGQINYNSRNNRTGNQFNVRIDHVMNGGNDRIRGTYYSSGIETWTNYVRSAFNHPYPVANQLFTLGYTKVLSNTILNEVGFGFVRMHGETGDPTPETPTISISAIGGIPGFGVDFWHPIYYTQNNFEFKDTLTMTRGSHSLRMGGQFSWGADDSEMHHWQRPNYSFQSIFDFADDEPFTETRAVDPATGKTIFATSHYRTKEFSGFIQDNWKVRPNLTLNVGLRYDNFGNPTKSPGQFNAISIGSGSTRQEQIATAKAVAADRLYNTDWNNVAPRFGFAWDPTTTGRMVVRGGWGISYNRINNTVWSDEKFNPPQFAQATAGVQNGTPIVYTLGPNYPDNPALGRGVDANGGIKGARVALRVIDPATTTPYSYNWFAGIQREMPWKLVLDVNYIGSAGRNLMSTDGPGGEDYNRFAGDMLDGVRNRLNPSFASVGLAESRIDSKYNGLALGLKRRLDHGLSFQFAYTFGKTYDTPASATEVTQPQLDYGYADYDIRHKIAANILWQIPFNSAHKAMNAVFGGWQINTITFWQSGAPFNVTCPSTYPTCDFNADGVTGDRINGPTSDLNLGSKTQDDWLTGAFKLSGFSFPSQGTLGNLERNSLRGPSYFNTDVSLIKSVSIRRTVLQVRIEAFNAFNQVNLNNPSTSTTSTTFGRVTSTRSMRVIQLGAKLSF